MRTDYILYIVTVICFIIAGFYAATNSTSMTMANTAIVIVLAIIGIIFVWGGYSLRPSIPKATRTEPTMPPIRPAMEKEQPAITPLQPPEKEPEPTPAPTAEPTPISEPEKAEETAQPETPPPETKPVRKRRERKKT